MFNRREYEIAMDLMTLHNAVLPLLNRILLESAGAALFLPELESRSRVRQANAPLDTQPRV